jgi:YHS domain-containing protein
MFSGNYTYYFCSPRCKEQFDQNPERYTGQGTAQRRT